MESDKKSTFEEIASETAKLTPMEAAKVEGFIYGIKVNPFIQNVADSEEPGKAS